MTHIIPAIDLQNGQAVRLYKGDYDQKTIYSDQPEALAAQFETMGAEYLHLVDLDGAKAGTTANLETIRKIKQATKLKIELGGGIRDLETVSLYLDDVKLARVILGTAALENPVFLKAALAKYGAEKIVVGVDIKDGNVATAGWLETSSTPYLDFLHELENIGVTTTVITDISKDGTLTGPNFALYEEIARETKLNFVVSGGVKDATDIKQAQKADFYGIIVGKAYYEGKIDLEKVLKS
ncbi:1-(5-phosphoribosyl)-5-[(5-phosphoribosylamino)methylideneamino]imidazole-4-carboxamide isomerase [Lactococcus hircilactis]|uniref:1-(5-phosphoribosyl)-5-[(5-phosphoribosylamino)methylideneamino] imidazole-4-carboxamide isomerase n=2 Tax=Lactococcus hircilactis TaxID=1494462 RepID=A0A7X1Z8R0_9LACT|nr:1-(5-phosphoribosyl)-5-[(5-phosphoribosylamino)methylideneamino]imidazole-4-carboxamide isomerase [Lactococcus hircilactis]